MEEKIISKEDLLNLCKDVIGNGHTLITPGKTEYTVVKDTSEIVLDTTAKPTKASYKTFVFPKAEPVIYYKRGKNDVQLLDIDIRAKENCYTRSKTL